MAYRSKSKRGKYKATWYRPDQQTRDRRAEVYKNIDTMVERRNLTYPEFNDDGGDQTLRQFIDDGERRLNGYTLTRSAQGKDEWQANVFSQVTRAKTRAVVAGVALNFPEFKWKAWKGGMQSPQRAEAAKQMVAFSRQNDNPKLKMFWEAWECAGKGTVITYDGFRHTTENVPVIDEYDAETGDVKTHDEDVVTEHRAVDEIVPLTEIFIWDFYIHDIQEQERLAWIDYLSPSQCEKEYGKNKNYKYLKDGKALGASRYEGETDSYYYRKWVSRTDANDNKYERIRYYSKAEHCYEEWINGVLMKKTPLLWGGKKSRVYPFAKTIYEPFSNRTFFYGMSLPKLLQSFQDVDNITWDGILDNLYRSLNTRLIAGLANKDLLDIEDELSTQDDITYVPDVTQIRPMPTRGVQGGDIQLLTMVRQAMDFVSVDPSQQGVSAAGVSGKTAKEIMIMNERAAELRGIFFTMLEDLWWQKTRLRVPNVIINYMKPEIAAFAGEDMAQTISGSLIEYDVEDVLLSDGSKGTLGMAIFDSEKDLPSENELGAKEDAMREQGMNYKQIAMTSDYLDEWQFDFRIIPKSIEQQSQSGEVARITEKQQGLVTLYPERAASNKDKMFAEFVSAYGDSPEEYAAAAQQPPSPAEQGQSLLGLDNGGEPPQAA